MIKDLQELIRENIIDTETAQRIFKFYEKKNQKQPNRLVLIFGIIGAILIGVGIILIIAHNWDEYNKFTKSVLAFLPLLIGQASCFYTFLKKKNNLAWTEASSVFLFFSIGATISMIAQIYHIDGDLSDFILTWMILALPQVYILNSSSTSLFFISGITYYAAELGYSHFPSQFPFAYIVLLLLIVPHYYQLLKNSPKSNFANLHSRIISFSLLITVGTFSKSNEELLFISYISLLSAFFIFGHFPVFLNEKRKSLSFSSLGLFGIVITLLPLSFGETWKEIFKTISPWNRLLTSPEMVSLVITTSLSLYLLFRHDYIDKNSHLNFIKYIFLIFPLIFMSGLISPKISEIIVNLLLLAIGIQVIRYGLKEDHLGVVNYGLLIVTALFMAKFFDSELTFIFRGLMFVIIGLGFFYTNFMIIKKRK